MSEIDWSKVEGAQYWGPGCAAYCEAFYKKEGDEWFYACEYKDWEWGSLEREPGPDRMKILIPRPSAWSGDGLPPVGAVCEINGTVLQELRGEQPTWREVEIIAHTNFGGGDVAVGRDMEKATLGWGIARSFRPIRTPEQIAAEEREAAVREMLGLFGGTDSRDTYLMQRLYDAGYRKVEP